MGGTGSGCGKTTASVLLMACLLRRGLSVAPYKAGPDYIDPGFHRRVCGRPACNLDPFLMRRETPFRLLQNDADISVIEGVMGYYDGLDAFEMKASTYEIARLTKTPVILVADGSGGAASVAATVRGFETLKPDSGIRGVLVNRVSGREHYKRVKAAVEAYTGIPCVGFLTRQAALQLPSRHLGLITARETPDLLMRVSAAAEEAEQTLDLDRLLSIASAAGDLPQAAAPALPDRAGYRLGVALDEAFQFYYEANLQALRAAGMELVFFSPLRDPCLPKGLDGVYIGGGYPEVHKDALSANFSMRESLRGALRGGLRCCAECGGLLYLSLSLDGRDMCGCLPLACEMTDRLQHFGYVTVKDRTGLCFPAHEFHRARATPLLKIPCAYTIRKASAPGETWRGGYEQDGILASFAHVYFADRPDVIERFWP